MGVLANLTTDESIKASKDTVGGGYAPKPSGVYDGVIKVAYLSKSTGGATAVNLIVGIGDSEYRETVYITNKEGKNFYIDKNDGTKHYLPGFSTINDIALLTAQRELSQLDTERKVVKLWNAEQAKEVPTEVECITAMHGKPIKLGILEEITFKQVKQGNEYVPTSEVRSSNVINKVFHPTNSKTVNECRAKAETAEFIDKWKAKWDGKPNDKTVGKTPQAATTGRTSTAAPSATKAAAASLFN